MSNRSWTRDELIKVLSLYCQTPFGQMHTRNPAIIALADAVDRTSSAVALKLVNFASLDSELRARGIGGMKNTSKMDRLVWDEFQSNWDILADNSVVFDEIDDAERASRKYESKQVERSETEVVRKAVQRRGQSFFRASVVAAHDGKCCITGIASKSLLRASHIVPWSHDPALRLNPRNGLCLNELHDAAFDRGLITLSESFELQVSKQLKAEVPGSVYTEMFESRAGKPITMPERFQPAQEMLEFHRRNVFVA